MPEDPNALRENYRRLSDRRIQEIALLEVRELRSEAVQVLQAEIERRGLPPELHAGIEVQLRGLADPDFQELLAWFRRAPCPECGRRDTPLNAFRFGDRPPPDSELSVDPTLVAGCPDCLRGMLRKAERSTYAGCLTLPWAWIGLGRTMRDLNDLERAEAVLRENRPGPELAEYVHDRIGALVVARLRDLGRQGP